MLTEYVSVDSPVCLVGTASLVSTVLSEILPKPPETLVFATETQSEPVLIPAPSCVELPAFGSKGDGVLSAIVQPDSGMLLSQTRHVKLTDAHQFPIEPGDITLTPSVDLQDWSNILYSSEASQQYCICRSQSSSNVGRAA